MKKLIVYLLAVLLITGCLVMPVSAATSKIPEAGLALEIPPDFDAYTPYSTDEEFANLWGLSREDSIARMEETDYSLILRSPEHSVTMYFSVENTSETNVFSMTEEEFLNQAEDFLMRNKEVTADPVAVGVVVTDDSRWVYGVFDVPEGDSVRYFTVHNKMLYTVLGTNTMVVSQPLEVWQVDLMSNILSTAIYVPVKEGEPEFAPAEEILTMSATDTAPQEQVPEEEPGEKSEETEVPVKHDTGTQPEENPVEPSPKTEVSEVPEEGTNTGKKDAKEKYLVPVLIGIGAALILASAALIVVFSLKKKRRPGPTPQSAPVTREKHVLCVRCGTKLTETAKFCPNCGKKIDSEG